MGKELATFTVMHCAHPSAVCDTAQNSNVVAPIRSANDNYTEPVVPPQVGARNPNLVSTRTPDTARADLDGRDHNPNGYSMWLAGGGVKGGFQYGATDELGYEAVEGRTHLHDLHATVLHLLGLDHPQLTDRYLGRDFRLTDVHGRVVDEVIS